MASEKGSQRAGGVGGGINNYLGVKIIFLGAEEKFLAGFFSVERGDRDL